MDFLKEFVATLPLTNIGSAVLVIGAFLGFCFWYFKNKGPV